MIARSYCDETLPNSRRQTVAVSSFPGKLGLCNNSCSTHRMCRNVHPMKSVNRGVRIKQTRNDVKTVSALYFCKENLFLALPGFSGKLHFSGSVFLHFMVRDSLILDALPFHASNDFNSINCSRQSD